MGEARSWQRMPLIRVSSLIPVVRELDGRGLAADALLARHLMTREQLSNPYAEIPLARYIAFLEASAETAQDPGFGAAVGTAFRPVALGPVGLLFGASSTLRRGLERLVRTLTSWQDGTSIGLHDEDGTLVWTYRIEDPLIWPRRQDSEYTLAATVTIAREAFGGSARLVEADVEHAMPDDPAPLARILGIAPRYGEPGNRLVFDLREADRVRRTEDAEMMAMLARHLDDLRQPAGEAGLLAQVRAVIGLHLGHRTITVPMVARELGVSSRTLQRRLADEGTSLRELLNRVRVDLGRVHLRDGRASNAEIARALGYTDSTAFWRAFKAGTGRAPSSYRRGRE
ncbi:MAG TPA: AraC family transcriptional regulator [Amaricoccus sp.]|nr:AraC family transcriptional regulator [Amaricoccus sp.]